jgi:uncharacterized membrane protein
MILATLYQWLFLLHVLAGMVWLGGAVFVAALAARATRSDDAGEIARFVRGLRATAPFVLAPAAVTVAGFGAWLVLNSAAWSFEQGWVQLALGLFAAAFLIGAAYLSRRAIAAGRAAETGDAAAARRQLRGWAGGYGVVLALLLVTTWDMVFKPGL